MRNIVNEFFLLLMLVVSTSNASDRPSNAGIAYSLGRFYASGHVRPECSHVCPHPFDTSADAKIVRTSAPAVADTQGERAGKAFTYSIFNRIEPAEFLDRENVYEVEIIPGVWYRRITQKNPFPRVMHELVIDPQKANILVRASHDTCAGSEKPSEVAAQEKALAAINCSFFDYGVSPLKDFFIKLLDLIGQAQYDAFPVFALKINGKWLSLSVLRTGMFAWDDGGRTVVAGVAKIKCTLRVGDSCEFQVLDFNKPKLCEPIIYTDDYGAKIPCGKDISCLVIRDNHVVALNTGGGQEVEKGTCVYAQHGDIRGVALGDCVDIIMDYQAESPALGHALKEMPNVIGSTPLLLDNGTVTSTVTQGKSSFFTKLHPRTAIGLLPDGKWIFVVIDGRQSHSTGITLKDLARYMQQRGCVSALNLDGGGSSTMVIDNEVVNSPAGREYGIVARERPGASCLLVTARA